MGTDVGNQREPKPLVEYEAETERNAEFACFQNQTRCLLTLWLHVVSGSVVQLSTQPAAMDFPG